MLLLALLAKKWSPKSLVNFTVLGYLPPAYYLAEKATQITVEIFQKLEQLLFYCFRSQYPKYRATL